MFDLMKALPGLLRTDVEYGESNFPELPAEVPEVVAADPSWCRRWMAARERLQNPPVVFVDQWDDQRIQRFGRLLAAVGWGELRHIVLGLQLCGDPSRDAGRMARMHPQASL